MKMPGLLEDANTSSEDKKQSSTGIGAGSAGTTTLPSGIVLDKDGKPCRTCTSSAAWKSMMSSSFAKKSSSTIPNTSSAQAQPQSQEPTTPSLPPSTASQSPPTTLEDGCPPDVEELGRASWTLLHALTATYPPKPTPAHQAKTSTFIEMFSQLYPCWHCAEDFRTWIARPENDPTEALKTQDGFGRWMCKAHNDVNKKLGKKEFDCNFWKERWKDGYGDGRCD